MPATKGQDYRYDKDVPFSALVGRTLVAVRGLTVNSEKATFVCDTGEEFTLFHSQDCCESVQINDVIGAVDDLIGTPILMAEESSRSGDIEYGTQTWTFYKLATVKGYVDIRWLGESNGYYSESVDFYQSVVLVDDTREAPALPSSVAANVVSPVSEVRPVPLHLTALEYGVLVALAGIGLSAMTSNTELAQQYRAILERPETADVAFAAFEKALGALTAMEAA